MTIPSQCEQAVAVSGIRGLPTGLNCDCENNRAINADSVKTGWPRFASYGLDCELTENGEALGFEAMMDEIQKEGRPVPFAWRLPNRAAHMMLARGAYTDTKHQIVLVNDPSPVCNNGTCKGGRVCEMSWSYYDRAAYGSKHTHWRDVYAIKPKSGARPRCDVPSLDEAGGSFPSGTPADARSLAQDRERVEDWVGEYLEATDEAGRSALGVPREFSTEDLAVDDNTLPVRFVYLHDLNDMKRGGAVWQRSPDGWDYAVAAGKAKLVAEEYRGGPAKEGLLCNAADQQALLDKAADLRRRKETDLRGDVERVVMPELNLDMLSYEDQQFRYFVLTRPYTGLEPAAWSSNGDDAANVVPRLRTLIQARPPGPG